MFTLDFLYISRNKNNDLQITYRINNISTYFILKFQNMAYFDLFDIIDAIEKDYKYKYSLSSPKDEEE